MYAGELSANAALRKAVAGLAESGAPVSAECAGLLYLARSLDGLPMCGVLDAEARMSKRLTLGYREAVAVSDSVLAAPGTRVRGHEFHRTVLEPGMRRRSGVGHAPAGAAGRGVRTAGRARELSAHPLGGGARYGPPVRRAVRGMSRSGNRCRKQ